MKYSTKTIETLIRLRDGEQINEGAVSSKQLKSLIKELESMHAVSFNRRGRLRGYYVVTNRERFLEACRQIDPSFENLENALLLAKGEIDSRQSKTATFGNSKQGGADRTIKGFSLLADRKVFLEYLGETVPVGPLTGLHVVDRNALILPENACVIIVENPGCFYDLNWIPNVGLSPDEGPFIVLCRYPISEEAKLWLETIPNRILYFGDYDLAGIRIYETEFKRRLKNKVSFIIPEDIEARIRKSGNPDLYTKQINEGFSSVSSTDKRITNLIRLIHSLQSGYEQEGYCFGFDVPV